MKHLPIGIQEFEIVIDDKYLYVDKTEQIYHFITKSRYYFLARPRRFGKSLLVSTLKEIFLGNKHLFKDLWIGKSDYDWDAHPVIHIDFSGVEHGTIEELKKDLSWTLSLIAQDHGLDIPSTPSIQAQLKLLVRQLARKYRPHRVVILVDEYDYPILSHLHDIKSAQEKQAFLRSFYSAIKSLNSYIHFVFVTGVSKFSRTSVFSGLNNLKDITNTSQGASLLGYTQKEVEFYFQEHIEKIAHQQKSNAAAIIEDVRLWYNGYRFSKEETYVYNPYSVLLYLDSGEIENYWFESGTPTFLITIIRQKYRSLKNVERGKVSVSSLGTFNIENIPLITILFQAGYLTIKDYNHKTRKFTLGSPNQEVLISFQKNLLSAFTYADEPDVENYLEQIKEALEKKDIEQFCLHVKSLFANIPYHLHLEEERYYHSIFQCMAYLLGMDAHSEVAMNKGRIDLVLVTKKYMYLLEFKFNHSARKALKQIESKKYYEKYLGQGKKIVLLGISFNRKENEFTIDYEKKAL